MQQWLKLLHHVIIANDDSAAYFNGVKSNNIYRNFIKLCIRLLPDYYTSNIPNRFQINDTTYLVSFLGVMTAYETYTNTQIYGLPSLIKQSDISSINANIYYIFINNYNLSQESFNAWYLDTSANNLWLMGHWSIVLHLQFTNYNYKNTEGGKSQLQIMIDDPLYSWHNGAFNENLQNYFNIHLKQPTINFEDLIKSPSSILIEYDIHKSLSIQGSNINNIVGQPTLLIITYTPPTSTIGEIKINFFDINGNNLWSYLYNYTYSSSSKTPFSVTYNRYGIANQFYNGILIRKGLPELNITDYKNISQNQWDALYSTI